MLPAPARLRSSTEFALALRGRRCARPTVVLHLGRADDAHIRVGMAVSKLVGNAVTRHAVARRLRHLMGPRLHRLPQGARLVVRALPASALADSALLGRDLDAALDELMSR